MARKKTASGSRKPSIGQRRIMEMYKVDYNRRKELANKVLQDLADKLASIDLKPSDKGLRDLAIDLGLIEMAMGRYGGLIVPLGSPLLDQEAPPPAQPTMQTSTLSQDEQLTLQLLLRKLAPASKNP